MTKRFDWRILGILLIALVVLVGCAPAASPTPAPVKIPTDTSPEALFFGHNTLQCNNGTFAAVIALSDVKLDGPNDVLVTPIEITDYWQLKTDITYPTLRFSGETAAAIKKQDQPDLRLAWAEVNRTGAKGISAKFIRLLTLDEEKAYREVVTKSKSPFPVACQD